MKKILLAIDTNSSGGAERVVANLANYFVQNHHVILVNSDTTSCFYPIDDRVRVIKLGLNENKKSRVFKFVKKVQALCRIFKNEKPDVVIAFLFRMEAPAIIAALLTGTQIVTSVRNSAEAYNIIERRFRQVFYPHIKGVVFQSKAVLNHSDFKHVRMKTDIMKTISVDFKKTQLPKNNRKKWIITVGRLHAQKNQKMLIEAFSRLADDYPEFELHIFGKGELKKELEQYIEKQSCSSRIILEGEVQDAITRNQDVTLFVLCSDYEGFPNALAEAMAYGLPTISTDFDSGVAHELIVHRENGCLCRVGDVYSLEQEMRYLLNLSEQEREMIGNKAAKVYSELSNSVIGKKWEDFVL